MKVENNNRRFKKALVAAMVAFILCLIPLVARIWLDRNGALERPDLGVVGEFVVRDHEDVPLTRDHLRRSQSIILYWPSDCAAIGACSQAYAAAENLKSWVEKSLKPKWTEENNPLILAVIGQSLEGFSSFIGWRRFTIESDNPMALIPQGIDLKQPALIIVDNTLQFAAYYNLSKDVDLTKIERVLSKTAFDQYLGNYLSRRTFMGPKRTQN